MSTAVSPRLFLIKKDTLLLKNHYLYSNNEDLIMSDIDNFLHVENQASKSIDFDADIDKDYETMSIEDPLVWLYLDRKEVPGLMNNDFLEFFTI